ncbi:GNAT family N-acetyltransferase [Arthrobacter sp. NPDC058097]|uniref:GNAT family N-acetyltransferase n=1 Tax=Arthrobacter sp. NPDC058097 TaxID=3346340 RepID=UPI0036DB31CB
MTLPGTATQYRIREARESELDAVGRLTYEGFGHHLPGSPVPAPDRLELLLDAASRAREGVLLVAEDEADGGLVGTASLLPFGSSLARQALDGEMELRLLAVLPQARRSGIGRRLLAESANLARATGASGLVLDTGADNERSQQLYRRFGFVRRPERERPRPAPKVQLVVYTLDLAGYQAA